jgi:ZIP family zinc transporter
MDLTPIALAAALTVIHYASEVYAGHQEKHHWRILSFSAGAFITLLFLEMMPRATSVPYGLSFMLLGFVCFHAVEKYVYQHYHKDELRKRVGALDTIGFFGKNFLNGFVLVIAFDSGTGLGYALFAALLLHTISSSLVLSHLVERIKGIKNHRLLLSSGTLLGALLAVPLGSSSLLATGAFAFITGELFYIVARDVLPRDGAGRMVYFSAGVLAMYFLLLLAGVA